MKERCGKVIAVVGMQWGSEGKGAIISYLTPLVNAGIRTGSANAGHTIYVNGQPIVMRQLPCVWVNPLAQLLIGPGAIISLDVLLAEIDMIDAIVPAKNRLRIDPRAHVVTDAHIEAEALTDLAARIGSTSARSAEGIGAARAAKLMRQADCLLAIDVPELKRYIADTSDIVNTLLEMDGYCLLEGTQGYGLSLDHGEFPFVTSIDTSVGSLAASAGIAMHEFPVDVIGVVRTYPIRVAGNSGPFGTDSKELSWKQVAKRCGADKDITEYTTVTKLPRRVATFSELEFSKACRINRPTEIALTFCDYLDWSIHEKDKLSFSVEMFIDKIEQIAGTDKVTLTKTGPKTLLDFDPYRRNMLRRIAC